MKLLTRAEELILLAIWKLKEDAYCVPILDEIEKVSNKKWTLGGIYVPLHRLEKDGYVTSYLGEPTNERGGKSKRYYNVTPKGVKALQEIKKLQDASWQGVSDLIFE
ncbi:PadR family transcriptional regulator [candidate division KSB1 bacterium]